jgi:hypothetical protein
VSKIQTIQSISKELNSESSHFLLELIQNANDNDYESNKVPQLNFEYKNGYLRVDCNEKGFFSKHILAICQVGNSTKAKAKKIDGPIGEKGIGFKSVFKVADEVYITSRNFSFKFDAKTDLGMVAPIWSDPPSIFTRRLGFTSFYILLRPKCQMEVLRKLKVLDVTILAFLKNLRYISISIDTFRITLRRENEDSPSLGPCLVLYQDNEKMIYTTVKRRVKCLPYEEKRPGISESDVVLAFPIKDEVPVIADQQVFAHLPLRQYGFQFLVQGDFLTVANREDVAVSNDWNLKLREEVLEALLDAVHLFSQSNTKLRFTWIRFLPWKSPVYGFFRRTASEIFRTLKEKPVLRNHLEELKKPSELIFVPPEFCSHEGIPITQTNTSAHRYLSRQYDRSDKQALLRLGVQEMDIESFIEEVRRISTAEEHTMRSAPTDWHSRLASILLEQKGSTKNWDLIKQLKLIPLRDGRWVSGSDVGRCGHEIWFPNYDIGYELPTGLPLHLVSDEAVRDRHRKGLFKALGMTQIDVLRLANFLEGRHADDRFAATLKFQDVLSQLIFMFRVQWRGKADQSTLWVFDEHGSRRRGQDVYIDSTKPSAASLLLLDRRTFHFLHPDIVNAVGQDSGAWHQWLLSSVQVAIYPRLENMSNSTSPKPFEMHSDFQYLLTGLPSKELLQLLRDNFVDYKRSFRLDEQKSKNSEPILSRTKLAQRLASLSVRCLDGSLHQLSQTFLPLKELKEVAPGGRFPFVDVEDPDHPHWGYVLHHFGVTKTDTFDFYITCMRGWKAQDTPPLATIFRQLEYIQARSGEAKKQVKEAFEKYELVYIPPVASRKGFWVKPSQCIWEGPAVLRSAYALSSLYPDSKRLFTSLLGLQDANLQHLIMETKQFVSGDSIQYIAEVFKELEKFLTDKTPLSETSDLSEHNIFPIRMSTDQSRFDCLRGASQSHIWWIADTTHLLRSFEGRVPLLALSVEDVGGLKRLFKFAKVDLRKLSHAVEGNAQTSGYMIPWEAQTTLLQGRANSILRLVPDTEPNRNRIFKQMRAVSVYKAQIVIQEWQVPTDGSPIKGREEEGKVALKFDGDSLHVYFAADSAETKAAQWQLIDRLYEFCGMGKIQDGSQQHKFLLTQIMQADMQEEIDDLLDRAAVPPLASDEAVDEAAERLRREQARQNRKPSSRSGEDSPWNARRSSFQKLFTAGGIYVIGGFGENLFGNGSGSPFSAPSGMYSPAFPEGLRRAMEGTIIYGGSGQSRYGRQSGEKARAAIHSLHAEELFNQFLISLRKDGLEYDPSQHWSRQRTRGSETPSAAFVLPDQKGILTYMLSMGGYSRAEKWLANPPTYHIEVKSTSGGICDSFWITPKEFERGRSFVSFNADDGIVKHVSVLVVYYEINSNPKKVIIPNFIVDRQVKLESPEDLSGNLVDRGLPSA